MIRKTNTILRRVITTLCALGLIVPLAGVAQPPPPPPHPPYPPYPGPPPAHYNNLAAGLFVGGALGLIVGSAMSNRSNSATYYSTSQCYNVKVSTEYFYQNGQKYAKTGWQTICNQAVISVSGDGDGVVSSISNDVNSPPCKCETSTCRLDASVITLDSADERSHGLA